MTKVGDNLFIRIFRFLTGYVLVTVEGFFLEKFTNLCAINNLPFWDIRRFGSAKLVGKTTISGFKKMRHEAKKCGCRIYLSKKRGTPFLLYRYKKRKIFIVGLILFFVCIKISGLFVWNVEIVGNETIKDKEILAELENIGIKKWVLKSKLDASKLSNQLMIKRNDLSWVGIEIDGIKVNVKIVEKPKVPERIDKDMTCNIISSKPGLIVSIDTYQGTSKVKPGDVVDKGVLLVEGIVEMKQFPEKTEMVHSLADIKAKVWYEETKSFNFSKLRQNSEMEVFAYKLAYQTVMKNILPDTEIINVSKSVSYTDDKVLVTVTVETLEDIGVKVSI